MATLEAPVRPRTALHQGPFVTEPFFDFRNEDNARRMRAALAKVRGQLGGEYDLIIGGKRVKTNDKIKSLNPSQPSQIVGTHQKAGPEQVEPALKAALKAFASWSRTTVEERTGLVFRVGDLLRQRKMEFMAWLVFEVSKNWAEADADISETIDFCEFYAREALRFSKAQTPIQLPGERDTLLYIPLGVGAVIPPWNFPCAIMAGMTLASIVSGNTVILKPSSDSPTIAAKFVELLEEAGMPEGVVNFCPGAGASFGDAVIAHPKTATLPSLAPAKSVCISIKLPRRKRPARSGSSALFLRWAAKTRSSSMPTLTSIPPLKALPSRHSASRARSAQPARAPSWMSESTTSSSSSSKPAWKQFRPAIPPRTPTWARSSTKVR
jgi:hypothetical protein